jgi:hypothetical protein
MTQLEFVPAPAELTPEAQDWYQVAAAFIIEATVTRTRGNQPCAATKINIAQLFYQEAHCGNPYITTHTND